MMTNLLAPVVPHLFLMARVRLLRYTDVIRGKGQQFLNIRTMCMPS
jgi:hypothetical protein